jgi:hypothetical protein
MCADRRSCSAGAAGGHKRSRLVNSRSIASPSKPSRTLRCNVLLTLKFRKAGTSCDCSCDSHRLQGRVADALRVGRDSGFWILELLLLLQAHVRKTVGPEAAPGCNNDTIAVHGIYKSCGVLHAVNRKSCACNLEMRRQNCCSDLGAALQGRWIAQTPFELIHN